jgi:hypothetical protein
MMIFSDMDCHVVKNVVYMMVRDLVKDVLSAAFATHQGGVDRV